MLNINTTKPDFRSQFLEQQRLDDAEIRTRQPKYQWDVPMPVVSVKEIGKFHNFIPCKNSEIPSIQFQGFDGLYYTHPLKSWEWEQFKFDDVLYRETVYFVTYEVRKQLRQQRIEVAPASTHTIH